jgi:hypothetical protein
MTHNFSLVYSSRFTIDPRKYYAGPAIQFTSKIRSEQDSLEVVVDQQNQGYPCISKETQVVVAIQQSQRLKKNRPHCTARGDILAVFGNFGS